MNNLPLVSVLIPCYNAIKTVQATITSVLNQTYTPIEILVNDDDSKDGTYEFLIKTYHGHPHIKISKNPKNLGIAGNWNVIFKNAQGKYWLKLDGDDLLQPSFLQETVEIAEFYGSDFTGTSFESYNMQTKQKKTPYIHQFMESGLLNNPLKHIFITHPFHLCFTLLRADFVKSMSVNEIFFIDTEVCDAEFQIRAALQPNFKAYFLNKSLAYYCFHGTNSSTVPLKQARSFIYDLVGLHHAVLKEKLGLAYRTKIKKSALAYLKLMLKREAPLDIKLLATCIKRVWY